MTAITAQVDRELQNLRDAAMSGQLGSDVSLTLKMAVDAVYSAPGNFKSTTCMLTYTQTLFYLVELHVYRKR